MQSRATILILIFQFSLSLGFPSLHVRNSATNQRIVGGLEASDGQFPYVVSVRRSGSHMCGGSILTAKWVLTAAHCVAHYNISTLAVVAGSIERDNWDITRQIARMIEHEAYDFLSLRNDIALLELTEELTLDDKIQPIELETEEVGIKECVVTGWGRLSYQGESPTNLQYLLTNTIDREECEVLWDPYTVHDTEICTLKEAGEGICSGDSGSPLVGDGRQIGIVSWGNPCATGIPDVYVKVSDYIDWINEVLSS